MLCAGVGSEADLQQVELVHNAQAHAARLPLLLLDSIQRGMQHELVQVLRPVIAAAGLACTCHRA